MCANSCIASVTSFRDSVCRSKEAQVAQQNAEKAAADAAKKMESLEKQAAKLKAECVTTTYFFRVCRFVLQKSSDDLLMLCCGSVCVAKRNSTPNETALAVLWRNLKPSMRRTWRIWKRRLQNCKLPWRPSASAWRFFHLLSRASTAFRDVHENCVFIFLC